MLGTFGFSYIGLIFLLMLFIPNIIWTKYKPEKYEKAAQNENKILLAFEKTGQAAATCSALIFSDFNINGISAWSLWLLASFLLMILYEICWIRYFRSKHKLSDFYGNFIGIPLPLATLPVAAFILLGIYGRVIWLIAASVILGIGHIGIHMQHSRACK